MLVVEDTHRNFWTCSRNLQRGRWTCPICFVESHEFTDNSSSHEDLQLQMVREQPDISVDGTAANCSLVDIHSVCKATQRMTTRVQERYDWYKREVSCQQQWYLKGLKYNQCNLARECTVSATSYCMFRYLDISIPVYCGRSAGNWDIDIINCFRRLVITCRWLSCNIMILYSRTFGV